MSTAIRITPTDEQLASIRYNGDGLVPAIVQDHRDGAVLMMGWMNAETLGETLETGRMVYWSRSRQERWRKGDTSGDFQWVRSARYDCDGDTLLFLVEQEGRGACHTGNRSCFFRALGSGLADSAAVGAGRADASADASTAGGSSVDGSQTSGASGAGPAGPVAAPTLQQ